MRYLVVLGGLLLAGSPALAGQTLSKSDTSAAFRAAGFHYAAGQWRSCEDPGTASYEPGALTALGDVNGDGQPEAIITEQGTYCYGFTGAGFALVSRQPKGNWRLMARSIGIPRLLASKGKSGWPDIEVGGPGFCFPILRWNGSAYVRHRYAYEGKPCKP